MLCLEIAGKYGIPCFPARFKARGEKDLLIAGKNP
jgi:hypothetical protein